jgi:hypothetical protein
MRWVYLYQKGLNSIGPGVGNFTTTGTTSIRGGGIHLASGAQIDATGDLDAWCKSARSNYAIFFDTYIEVGATNNFFYLGGGQNHIRCDRGLTQESFRVYWVSSLGTNTDFNSSVDSVDEGNGTDVIPNNSNPDHVRAFITVNNGTADIFFRNLTTNKFFRVQWTVPNLGTAGAGSGYLEPGGTSGIVKAFAVFDGPTSSELGYKAVNDPYNTLFKPANDALYFIGGAAPVTGPPAGSLSLMGMGI